MELLFILIVSFVFIPFVLMMISYQIILRIWRVSFLEFFFCNVMKWHSLSYECVHYHKDDPLKFQEYAACQWCGYKGMIDSQGNLF